jgi:hypothetical protein
MMNRPRISQFRGSGSIVPTLLPTARMLYSPFGILFKGQNRRRMSALSPTVTWTESFELHKAIDHEDMDRKRMHLPKGRR